MYFFVKKKPLKIIAIIPARAGSKGVKNKNITNFCGKPLLWYTVNAAKKSALFDRIIVSTDSEKFASVARASGAEVPYLRPLALATDTANVADTVIDLLHFLQKTENYTADVLFLLQPTSPLREAADIVASYAEFKKLGNPALVSLVKTHHQIYKVSNGIVNLINKDAAKLVNRQELPDTFRQDGSMIYIIDIPFFLKHKDFMPVGQTSAYIVPKWKAVDIDDPEDFAIAESMYKNRVHFKKFV